MQTSPQSIAVDGLNEVAGICKKIYSQNLADGQLYYAFAAFGFFRCCFIIYLILKENKSCPILLRHFCSARIR
jgi:hypothetical protein